MRWSAIVRYALLAVSALFVLVVALALSIDLGRFKGVAESYLSGLIERELAIDGPLHLTLGRTIAISADDVRLAAADWSTAPELARIRHIAARIDTLSLFSGPVRIESLVIDGAVVSLERDAELGSNWDLIGGSPEASPEASAEARSEARSEAQTPARTDGPEAVAVNRARGPALIVDAARVADAAVSYRGPVLREPVQLAIDEWTASIDPPGRVDLNLQGSVNQTPFELGLSASTIEQLLSLGTVEFVLAGNLGEIDFGGDAAFGNLRRPSRPSVNLTLSGPNIEYLTDLLRLERITTGPLDLMLSIVPAADRMELSLNGVAGEFTVSADGRFDSLRELENLDLRFGASGPSAQTVAAAFGWPNVPPDPFDITGTVRREGRALAIDDTAVTLSDARFDLRGQFTDFPRVGSATASVRVTGPDIGRFNRLLGLPGRLEGAFSLEADLLALDAGGAEIAVAGATDQIRYGVEGIVTDTAGLVGSMLRVELAGPDLGVITQAVRGLPGPDEAFSGSFSIERVADGVLVRDGLVAIGEDQLTVDGRIGNDPRQAFELRFDADAGDLKGRLASFGVPVEALPSGNLQATGSILNTPDGIVLEGAALSYAQLQAQVDGTLGTAPGFAAMDLVVQLAGETLAPWLPSFERAQLFARPFTAAGRMRRADRLLEFSDLVLQIDETRLSGTVALTPRALLERGRLSIDAASPDILPFTPRVAEFAAAGRLPLVLHSEIEWNADQWNIAALELELADDLLLASGVIDAPPDFRDTDLRFDWRIASLGNYSALAGRALPMLPARFTFDLSGTPEEISIDNFAGELGASDLAGSFSYRDGTTPAIELDIRSDRIDLSPFLPEEATAGTAEAPALSAGQRLIPDFPIPMDLLETGKLSARIDVAEIIARQRTLRNLSLRAAVADGALSVNGFELQADRGGSVVGMLNLGPGAAGAELGLHLNGRDISLGLPANSPEELAGLPTYAFDLGLLTQGATLRELAGNLDGYLKLIGSEGRLRTGRMRMFTNDFLSELLRTINPFIESDPYSNLSCAVILLTAEDGLLLGDPAFVMQSDRLKIIAAGSVDLKTEEILADFNTVPQRGLGISLSNLVNPFVRVSGTLARPSLDLDPRGTIIQGGAAVATGGLSILARGLAERFLTSRDPCANAIEDTQEQFRALEEAFGIAALAADTALPVVP